MSDRILGVIVEKNIFIGKVMSETEDRYILTDVVMMSAVISVQSVGYITFPFACKKLSIPKNVITFEPDETILEQYQKEIARKSGLEIPDFHFPKSIK